MIKLSPSFCTRYARAHSTTYTSPYKTEQNYSENANKPPSFFLTLHLNCFKPLMSRSHHARAPTHKNSKQQLDKRRKERQDKRRARSLLTNFSVTFSFLIFQSEAVFSLFGGVFSEFSATTADIESSVESSIFPCLGWLCHLFLALWTFDCGTHLSHVNYHSHELNDLWFSIILLLATLEFS